MERKIEHQDDAKGGAFFIEGDGTQLAKMTYERTGPSSIVVNHTEVDSSLQGQGVGHKLIGEMAKWARETGTKVSATCTYAAAQLAKDASMKDILA